MSVPAVSTQLIPSLFLNPLQTSFVLPTPLKPLLSKITNEGFFLLILRK